MDEASVRSKMQSSAGVFTSDIAGIRTGRATPSLVENIICPAYGGTQRLKVMELATISAPDPSQIIINPWDKSIIGDIRKGIVEANIGMNPSIDGEFIRITMPPLTTEDREKYVKLLNQKLENGKRECRRISSTTGGRGSDIESPRKCGRSEFFPSRPGPQLSAPPSKSGRRCGRSNSNRPPRPGFLRFHFQGALGNTHF